MQKILENLFSGALLTQDEAKGAMLKIASGKLSSSLAASFLTVFNMRKPDPREVTGFREALLDLCLFADLSRFDPVDLCGTGGDGKDTFNISTLAAFIAAGSGAKVAKHGNYGKSSVCGSSNVLEHLGVKFSADITILEREISEAGICICHAPLFHPALKNADEVRSELGFRTVFNLLGPLVNPCGVKRQFAGVYSQEAARLYGEVFAGCGFEYYVVHSLDGYDEISLTGPFLLVSAKETKVLEPADLNLSTVSPESLSGGGSVDEAAEIFLNVLNGQGTVAQSAVACVNAAFGIMASGRETEFKSAYEAARESLDSGAALASLNKLREISKS